MLLIGLATGGLFGLGLTLLARGLFAAPAPLEQALEQLTVGGPRARTREAATSVRAATRLASAAARIGLTNAVRGSDLRVVERTLEEHHVEKLAGAVAGLVLPVALGAIVKLGGVGVSGSFVVMASLGLAAAGYVLPDLLLRAQAAERRRGFRYALSSYLDLVNVILAAGTGVETALQDAAGAGRGWAFRELQRALDRARLGGMSPWRAFGELGVDLDVPELREVASSLDLAGTHGARIRASLEARAKGMRNRDLAETEADAEAATERMTVPSVVLVVGFIVFVGFPAAYEILGF